MPITAIAAGVGAVGAIGGAVISSNAAKDAARTEARGAKNALARQDAALNTAQATLKPYTDIGLSVLPTLSSMISGGADSAAMLSNLENYPGYKFALEQGRRGLDADLAKMGSRVSGNAIAGGINYNQNAATTLFDRYFSHLTDLAGISGNAAMQSSSNAINAGNSMGQTEMARANASAGGKAAQGNIWGGLVGQTLPAIAGTVAGAWPTSTPAGTGNTTAASSYNNAIFGGGARSGR